MEKVDARERLNFVPGLAARWGTSERWVIGEIRSGRLRARKLGKRWTVREEEADRFEREAGEEEGGPDAA